MKDETRLGMNRTGLHMSPIDAGELEYDMDAPVPAAEGSAAAAMRRQYVSTADTLGTVPPPGTMRGMLASGMEALSGNRMQAFLDKLAERLAFERGGTRLYDAFLVKLSALPEQLGPVDIDTVRRFRDQEAEHAALVRDTIEQLGGDPTAQTPGADLVGVQTMGILASVVEPRTTLGQCLNSVLAAELVDTAAWELLVELATGIGHPELAERFTRAANEEMIHTAAIREWLAQHCAEQTGATRRTMA